MTAVLTVRRELPSDVDVIREIHTLAFALDPVTGVARPPGPIEEAVLVDDLRRGDGWIPALSLVAELDGKVVGHTVTSRGWITRADGSRSAALGLGPIGVLPRLHGGGIGSALMYATIGAAEALDESVICLLGWPGYYARFGFVASADAGIEPPNPAWGAHFQALPLTAGHADPARLSGRFEYDPAFGT